MERAIVLQQGMLVFRALREGEAVLRFDDAASALRWLSCARGEVGDERTLRHALDAVSPGLDVQRAARREVLEHVGRRLASGRLRAAVALPYERLRPAEPDAPVEKKAAKSEQLTWVAIQLVDDDDPPKPVSRMRYRVHLPDGTTREGVTDEQGTARFDGIPGGECDISFPDLDAADWKAL